MTLRLHWKLMLATTVPVIALITGVIWLAFDQLAADYFMVLMDKYMVSPTKRTGHFWLQYIAICSGQAWSRWFSPFCSVTC